MAPLTVDGVSIVVERHGRGPSVVLVHGLGGPATWERVVPLLAGNRSVVVPHLPGFGQSPPAVSPLRAEDHARLLARLLDETGPGPVTVAGTSYGGEIAALMAAGRPDRVARLVLVSPTGTRRYPWPLRASASRAALRPFIRLAVTNRWISGRLSARAFHDSTSRPDDLVERYLGGLRLPGRTGALLDAIEDIWSRGGGLPAVVRELRIPVTLAWGEHDRTIPFRYSGPLRGYVSGTGPVIIGGCGHSAPLERPDVISRLIAEATSVP